MYKMRGDIVPVVSLNAPFLDSGILRLLRFANWC